MSTALAFAPFGLAQALGSVLLWAGASKLFSRERTRRAIADYRILPEAWATPAATLLPAGEVVLALLLVGWPAWAGLALAAAGALFLTFSLAQAVNLLRGRRIACGCFGPSQDKAITWTMAARNALVVACCVLLDWVCTTVRIPGDTTGNC